MPPHGPKASPPAADDHVVGRVARPPAERRRGGGDGWQEQIAVNAYTLRGPIHLRPGLLPEVERFVIQEVDADRFQDGERGVVQPLQRVGAQPVIG
jgi:hypothetical protein